MDRQQNPPPEAEAVRRRALTAHRAGDLDGAAGLYIQALEVAPDIAAYHAGLGDVVRDQGRPDRAAFCYSRALAITPDDPALLAALARALTTQGRNTEAIVQYKRIVALQPGVASAHINLANALLAQGRIELALAEYDRALEIDPASALARSNRLLCLNYSERAPEEIFADHRAWEAAHASAPTKAVHANERDPDRRLRIGYVSGDFRDHPVAAFIAPLLAAHDRAAVQVYAYADAPRPDAVTQRLSGLADRWTSIVGVSNEVLAEHIRAAKVDILVDLGGHTAGERLGLFARRPAPIQATWIGYPNTTGLSSIDYRLVDAVTDPPGAADALASETLVRLQDGFLCYEPPADAPEPGPPPSIAKGVVTFGSFNFPTKLSDGVLAAWAAILTRTPTARLLLKGGYDADPGARAHVVTRLAASGVAEDRIDFLPWTATTAEHLARYGEIDIALDTFPYNGTTTTCETLWMGVPLVALLGDRHAGRVSASLLTRVGLENLIAADVEAYVELATRLAGDPDRLAEIRRTLRPRMAASPLCDAPAFAYKLDAAYRTMWRDWLSS
jgi:protein O-GlcNAc transferase